MQKHENRYFVAQAVPEIYGKKRKVEKQGDVFFCYRLYTSPILETIHEGYTYLPPNRVAGLLRPIILPLGGAAADHLGSSG